MGCVKRTAGAVLFVAGFAIACPASAAPIVDVITGGPTSITVGTPLEVTHDFTNNLAPNDYLAGSDTITSADLVIVLTDDNGNEDYTIAFGTTPQVSNFTANINGNTNFNFSVVAQSLTDLSTTGTLDVTILATDCNGSRCDSYAFKFVSSTLTANTTRSQVEQASIAVPEPGTLALLALGLGLTGIAALQRRRFPTLTRARP